MEDRLSRVLAFAGAASRRESDRLIQEGHVTVNGEVITEPSHRVDPARDFIKVDGKRLQTEATPVFLVLNKPRGVLTTSRDPEGRATVVSLLRGYKGRIVPVGRLEHEDEGALLLTNDSGVAAALNAHDAGLTQQLLIKVRGVPDERTIARMRTGVPLEKGRTLPMQVTVVSSTSRNTWLRVDVREVRSQLFDQLLNKLRHPVMKLKRLTFAGIGVKGLAPGTFRQLTDDEVESLRKVAENPPGLPDALRLSEAQLDEEVARVKEELRGRVHRPEPTPVPTPARRGRGEAAGNEAGSPRDRRRTRPGAPGEQGPKRRPSTARHLRPGQDEGVGRFSRAGIARSRAGRPATSEGGEGERESRSERPRVGRRQGGERRGFGGGAAEGERSGESRGFGGGRTGGAGGSRGFGGGRTGGARTGGARTSGAGGSRGFGGGRTGGGRTGGGRTGGGRTGSGRTGSGRTGSGRSGGGRSGGA
ncbi:MAG: pseudouridine synthase, partial [Myxococcota bacterium]